MFGVWAGSGGGGNTLEDAKGLTLVELAELAGSEANDGGGC